MVDIPRILCPVDFSDVSRHALEHAVPIAQWYHSRITALHVIQPEIVLPPPMLFTEFAAMNEIEAHIEIEGRLRLWLGDAERLGLRTDILIEDGDPARAILNHAHPGEFDLVVMGTHGHSGFQHLVLGSVTEKVLRKAACPVLTVPPRTAAADRRVPYARLLCPIDFSESSIDALGYAFSMAEEADADLTLLHVREFGLEPEADVRRKLEALITDDMRIYCKPKVRIEDGKAYHRILDIAREERSDLIVIGVRGRNPVDVALFGSTTNHVVRSAPCPVLTLKK